MTNTKTRDVDSTVNQILQLEKEGCQMVRVSVPDKDSAKAISKIKEKIHIPLVADIHFDYMLALESIENGIDKLRINPGNIGDDERVRQVAIKAKQYNVPIRIGVNMGSLEKNIQEKYGRTPKAMSAWPPRHPKSRPLPALFHAPALQAFYEHCRHMPPKPGEAVPH